MIETKSMQSKIRDAEKLKIPYLVIVGDKEMKQRLYQ
jgi:threonyl-tRNA synthetase